MFRYPLRVSANSGSVICDSHDVPVMSCVDAERARFVVDALNDSAGHFLHDCKKHQALATARGEHDAALFWQRLQGNVKKARNML